jgi:hypothetical protein
MRPKVAFAARLSLLDVRLHKFAAAAAMVRSNIIDVAILQIPNNLPNHFYHFLSMDSNFFVSVLFSIFLALTAVAAPQPELQLEERSDITCNSHHDAHEKIIHSDFHYWSGSRWELECCDLEGIFSRTVECQTYF